MARLNMIAFGAGLLVASARVISGAAPRGGSDSRHVRDSREAQVICDDYITLVLRDPRAHTSVSPSGQISHRVAAWAAESVAMGRSHWSDLSKAADSTGTPQRGGNCSNRSAPSFLARESRVNVSRLA